MKGFVVNFEKYRITVVMKVETNIITSIRASLKGQTLILMIIYVETFNTNYIVFIDNAIMCLTSHWPIISSIRVSSLILTISLCEIKEKMSKLLIKYTLMYLLNSWQCFIFIRPSRDRPYYVIGYGGQASTQVSAQ